MFADDSEYVYQILDRDFPNREIETLTAGELSYVLVQATLLKRIQETTFDA